MDIKEREKNSLEEQILLTSIFTFQSQILWMCLKVDPGLTNILRTFNVSMDDATNRYLPTYLHTYIRILISKIKLKLMKLK